MECAATPPDGADGMLREERAMGTPTEIGRAFYAAMNGKDVEGMAALCADDIVGYSPTFASLFPLEPAFAAANEDRPGHCLVGIDAFIRGYMGRVVELPNSHIELLDECEGPDLYMVETIWRGTGYPDHVLPSGRIAKATNAPIHQAALNKFKIRDGRIAQIYIYSDNLEYFLRAGWLQNPETLAWLTRQLPDEVVTVV